MILKVFLIFHAIFAFKGSNRNSNRDIGSFLEQVYTNESFVEPKFNENCDEVSLEAAYECEAEFKIEKKIKSTYRYYSEIFVISI